MSLREDADTGTDSSWPGAVFWHYKVVCLNTAMCWKVLILWCARLTCG